MKNIIRLIFITVLVSTFCSISFAENQEHGKLFRGNEEIMNLAYKDIKVDFVNLADAPCYFTGFKLSYTVLETGDCPEFRRITVTPGGIVKLEPEVIFKNNGVDGNYETEIGLTKLIGGYIPFDAQFVFYFPDIDDFTSINLYGRVTNGLTNLEGGKIKVYDSNKLPIFEISNGINKDYVKVPIENKDVPFKQTEPEKKVSIKIQKPNKDLSKVSLFEIHAPHKQKVRAGDYSIREIK